MTKSDLIERICQARKIPTGRSEQIVNAIFDAIEQALNRGERVEIRGFGSFEVRDYRGYVGRNPRTGTTVNVKAKRLAFFKVGKELKDRVQKGAPSAKGVPALSAVDGQSQPGDQPIAPPAAVPGAESSRLNSRPPLREETLARASTP